MKHTHTRKKREYSNMMHLLYNQKNLIMYSIKKLSDFLQRIKLYFLKKRLGENSLEFFETCVARASGERPVPIWPLH